MNLHVPTSACLLFSLVSCDRGNVKTPDLEDAGPPAICDHRVVLPSHYFSSSWTGSSYDLTEITNGSTLLMYNMVAFYASSDPVGDTDMWVHEYFLYDSTGLLVSHARRPIWAGGMWATDNDPPFVAGFGGLEDYDSYEGWPLINGQTFSMQIRSSEYKRPECFAETAFLDIKINDVRNMYSFPAQADVPAWLYPVIDPPVEEAGSKPGPGHDTAAAEDSGR